MQLAVRHMRIRSIVRYSVPEDPLEVDAQGGVRETVVVAGPPEMEAAEVRGFVGQLEVSDPGPGRRIHSQDTSRGGGKQRTLRQKVFRSRNARAWFCIVG